MLTTFFASSTTGSIVVMDVRDGSTLKIYKGHAGPINDFIECLKPGLHLLVTAGDDSKCNIYDLNS